MDNMPVLMEKYNKVFEKEEEMAQIAKEKRKLYLQKTRADLGYHNVSVHDKRITLAMEERVKKEKEEMKAQKKKEKRGRKLSKLFNVPVVSKKEEE